MPIESSHNLDDDTVLKPDKKRSTYCYLFETLANAKDSGRFPDTDDDATLKRLTDFVEACELLTRGADFSGVTIRAPAAHTYFGQFMNHDISAPMGGLLRNAASERPVGIIGTVDPAGLGKDWRAESVGPILEHFLNEHENPLSLSSLYADGPESDDKEVRALYLPDKTFKLGKTVHLEEPFFSDMKVNPASVFQAEGAYDIPRWPEPPMDGGRSPGNSGRSVPPKDRKPLIADRRNDGNLILSQLHLAFMLVHNKAVLALRGTGTALDKVFDQARQLVTLHYHWLILNDFLPALLSKTVLQKPLSQWQDLKLPTDQPGSVPMEFTTAAFRFGHSMVGRFYDYNANFGDNGRMSKTGATLRDLFTFTSKGTMGNEDDPPLQLPDHWVIDWERLTRDLPPGGLRPTVPGQAEGIDFDFAPFMLDQLPLARTSHEASILFRNLLRGFHRRIPSGQMLAEACWGKGHVPLSAEDILSVLTEHCSSPGNVFKFSALAAEIGILSNTPAWLYFLCEARSIEMGERVGPTASKIIAATIFGLMHDNPKSVLNYKGGGWHPSQSPLKNHAGKPLDSIRSFLLFATETEPTPPA